MMNVQFNQMNTLSSLQQSQMTRETQVQNINTVDPKVNIEANQASTERPVQEPSRAEAETNQSQSNGGGRLRGFFSSVRSTVTSAAESVRNVAQNTVSLAQNVASTVRNTASNIASAVRESASNVRENVENLSENVSRLGAAAGNMLKDATAIVSTGVQTAVSIGADLAQTGASIVSGVTQMAQAFTGEQSFSERLGNLGEGVRTLSSAFTPLSNIPENFTNAREEISSRVTSIRNNWDLVTEQASEAKSNLVTIGQEVGQTASLIKDQLVQAGSDIAGAFGNDQAEFAFA